MRCWVIVIVMTRAQVRWSLLRAIVYASRSIKQMSHIILSMFSTVLSMNEWRDAVVSDLMTSSVKVWLATIEQSRLVQLDWISDISWCWRDSDLIERICMCSAQHCLNRNLTVEEMIFFYVVLCHFVEHSSFLSSASKIFQLMKRLSQSCRCWVVNYWWIIDD